MALVVEEINRVVINEPEELEEYLRDKTSSLPPFNKGAIINTLRAIEDKSVTYGVYWDYAWDSITITEYREVTE